MSKKKEYTIHLLGRDIEVEMNMSVIIAYEEITGTSFYGEQFTTTKSRYALLAAVLSKTDGDFADKLLTDVSPMEFTQAFEVVMEAVADFFEIPAVVPPEEQQEGEQQKN